MDELLRERLIRLLSEPIQVTNEEMQNAYGYFMKRAETATQSEKDYSIIFRTLNTTSIELVAVQALHRHEQGKKCPKICLSTKGFSSY